MLKSVVHMSKNILFDSEILFFLIGTNTEFRQSLYQQGIQNFHLIVSEKRTFPPKILAIKNIQHFVSTYYNLVVHDLGIKVELLVMIPSKCWQTSALSCAWNVLSNFKLVGTK